MKHAGADTMAKLAGLLNELRQRRLLKEKGIGVFYVRSKAFLHFHDDASGVFVDVKLDQVNYSRHRVNTPSEQAALLKKVDECLSGWNGTSTRVTRV